MLYYCSAISAIVQYSKHNVESENRSTTDQNNQDKYLEIFAITGEVTCLTIIIIIMVIFKCYFSGELIAVS